MRCLPAKAPWPAFPPTRPTRAMGPWRAGIDSYVRNKDVCANLFYGECIVKFIMTFVLSLLPHLAFAEATGGYGYGDDLAMMAMMAIIIVVVVIAGIVAFVKLRSKGK